MQSQPGCSEPSGLFWLLHMCCVISPETMWMRARGLDEGWKQRLGSCGSEWKGRPKSRSIQTRFTTVCLASETLSCLKGEKLGKGPRSHRGQPAVRGSASIDGEIHLRRVGVFEGRDDGCPKNHEPGRDRRRRVYFVDQWLIKHRVGASS